MEQIVEVQRCQSSAVFRRSAVGIKTTPRLGLVRAGTYVPANLLGVGEIRAWTVLCSPGAGISYVFNKFPSPSGRGSG